MRIGIDPAIDCVFKKLFGCEENKALLLDLVNAIMEESRENHVVEVEIVNPYNIKDFPKDKLSIVDVKAKNDLGEWLIIEMQISVGEYFPKRLLYYWARMYQSQLKEREQYHILKKVTLISICKESLPIETNDYWDLFKLGSVRQNHVILCDDLNIYTFELSKFLEAHKEMQKPIERWMYFLKHGEDLDDESLPPVLETPVMKKAVQELKKFSLDEIEREMYESRRMAILDEISKMADHYEKGIKKGEEIGIKKKAMETAKNMLLKGMDVSLITELTSLPRETVEQLERELKGKEK